MPDQVPSPDWDPHADTVSSDQLGAYDKMRQQCPVAYSETREWSLFRHEDVLKVLHDEETFSNVVSAHLSVPNGMDPPEHTPYRKLIEPFFAPEPMADFEPICRDLSRHLVASLERDAEVDVISALAQPFAVQVQCAFLGWPESNHEPLRQWTIKNQAAIAVQDRDALGRYAAEFSDYIGGILQERRELGAAAPDDVTTRLCRARIENRLLTDEEIVSILRNWTAGEIGTIAASVGILVQFLAEHRDLQNLLRAQPEKLPEAIDEILRLHGPLLSNRRVTKCSVQIGDRQVRAGERVTLLWVAANRDEAVFTDAQEFRWGRNPSDNLLYGAGVHVCPGAPLARLELRMIIEELLAATRKIEFSATTPPRCAVYPASGFAQLPVWIS